MLLFALALFAEQPDRWIRVDQSSKAYEEHLDWESVSRIDDKARVWIRRDYALNQGTVWYEIEFDCSKKKMIILAYIREKDGSISHNTAHPYKASSNITTDSSIDRAFRLVCR